MPRTNAVIACAIACMVTCSCFIPASASIGTSQSETHPWTVGAGWSFTWMIDASDVVFDRNTRVKFTVQEIRPIVSGSIVERRKLIGNLSRGIDIVGTEWTLMKGNVPYAEFEIAPEIYNLTVDAIGDNVLILPMALASPLLYFREAYSQRYSPSSWDITLDDSALSYEARNKTAPGQRIHVDFNDKGMVGDFLTTYSNGTTKFHMYLESTYDPNADLTVFINILTFSTVGTIIAIIIALLFKKYKIKARDVVMGVKMALLLRYIAVIENRDDDYEI
jgi:hypothetical protein